jgi:hypothetical protein
VDYVTKTMAKKNHITDWLTGVLPVLPTPFTPRDEVDYPALEKLVDFAARCGVKTVVTPAFGSEFYKLDGGERSASSKPPSPRPRKGKCASSCNATAVATALPRAYAASENQLFDYARRGVLKNAIVRPVTVELDADAKAYLDLLTTHLLTTIKE